MLALSNTELADTFAAYKEAWRKIVKANEELKEVKFEYKIGFRLRLMIYDLRLKMLTRWLTLRSNR